IPAPPRHPSHRPSAGAIETGLRRDVPGDGLQRSTRPLFLTHSGGTRRTSPVGCAVSNPWRCTVKWYRSPNRCRGGLLLLALLLVQPAQAQEAKDPLWEVEGGSTWVGFSPDGKAAW